MLSPNFSGTQRESTGIEKDQKSFDPHLKDQGQKIK